jgi:multidrug efflux pump subunit AcrB
VGVLGTSANTSALNVFALYGFSVLTGLFAKNAIDMLADVFNTIFKKVQAKDGLKGDEAKGGVSPVDATKSGTEKSK